MFFPFIAALCAWKPRVFRPAGLLVCTLVGVVMLRYYLWANEAPFYPAVYRPSHTHLDGLTIGVGLAALREYRPLVWIKLISRPWTLFIAGIILVGISMWGFADPAGYVFNFTFVSLGFGALVASALSPGFWLATVQIPGTATIATLAFTLYLTHKQMIHMAKMSFDNYMEHRLLTLALAILLMTVASCIVHFTIERPFLKFRDHLLRKKLNDL